MTALGVVYDFVRVSGYIPKLKSREGMNSCLMLPILGTYNTCLLAVAINRARNTRKELMTLLRHGVHLLTRQSVDKGSSPANGKDKDARVIEILSSDLCSIVVRFLNIA